MTNAEPDRAGGWFTRDRLTTGVLGVATVLAIYVCYLIAKPFIAPMAFALALAVATDGPYRALRSRLRKDGVSAVLAVVCVLLVLVLPLSLLGAYLVGQAAENLREFQEGQSIARMRAAIETHPQAGPIMAWLGSRLDLEGQLSRIAGIVAGQATNVLRESLHLVTQLVIMLFVLFFLYRDREKAIAMARRMAPLAGDEQGRLFRRIANTIRATVNGSMTVAAVQAGAAGIMYAALGVPGSILWSTLTFFAALVPMFGTVLIWGPIALWLLFGGSFVKAAILVGWGALAVGTIDNLLYPYLVGDKLRLHTVPTFFAIVGGIALFGPAGLILGPLTLAITTALLDIWWARTADGQAAEDKMRPDPLPTK